MKQPIIPRSDAEKAQWLRIFSNKLPQYAAKYNLSPAEITDMENSSAWFSYWLRYLNLYNSFLSGVTAFKNQARDAFGTPMGSNPTPPATGAPPTAVPPGIFVRANKLALGIKKRINYSVGDGKDLGIEGAEIAPTDPNTLKPKLKTYLVEGGTPAIKWIKKQTDGIEIYADRGTGQWQLIAVDTKPDYIDRHPLPATPATWKYRAIYRIKDEKVGQWSNEVSITVTGT